MPEIVHKSFNLARLLTCSVREHVFKQASKAIAANEQPLVSNRGPLIQVLLWHCLILFQAIVKLLCQLESLIRPLKDSLRRRFVDLGVSHRSLIFDHQAVYHLLDVFPIIFVDGAADVFALSI